MVFDLMILHKHNNNHNIVYNYSMEVEKVLKNKLRLLEE